MKAQTVALVKETIETPAEQESVPGPSELNDNVLLLPAPDAEDDSLSESEHEVLISRWKMLTLFTEIG